MNTPIPARFGPSAFLTFIWFLTYCLILSTIFPWFLTHSFWDLSDLTRALPQPSQFQLDLASPTLNSVATSVQGLNMMHYERGQ